MVLVEEGELPMITLYKGDNPGISATRCLKCGDSLKASTSTKLAKLYTKHMKFTHPAEPLLQLLTP